VQEAALFSSRGALIAFSGSERAGLQPDRPAPSLLRLVRQQQPYAAIESIPGKGLYLRVVVPVNVLGLNEKYSGITAVPTRSRAVGKGRRNGPRGVPRLSRAVRIAAGNETEFTALP